MSQRITRKLRKIERDIRKQISPELIKPKYRTAHPVAGACYVVSEAAYHILGGSFNGFKPMVGRVGDMTHWWLQWNSRIIDPTKSQFMHYKELKKFYDAGRGCGFLTKEPSKRAMALIRKYYAVPDLQ